MFGRGDEAAGQRVGAERGDRAETERARPDDGNGVAGDAGCDRGVDRARRRLDHHRGLVAHPVGHAVQLALVGDERGAPAAARVGAEAGLQTGLQVAEGETLASIGGALGTGFARRVDAAGRAGQHGLDDDTRAVVEVAHDLVPGHERERHDGLEPAGRTSLDRCQVRAADPRETGPHPLPAGSGERGLLRVARERERARLPCDARRGQAGQRPFEDERLHPALPSFLSYAAVLRTASYDKKDGGETSAFMRAARWAAAAAGRRAPSPSARRASPACGRWRPAWSRG